MFYIYIPVKHFVDLLWAREDMFFQVKQKQKQINPDPIKTIYLGWLKLNHPEIYQSFKVLDKLKGERLAEYLYPKLAEYTPLSKSKFKGEPTGRNTTVFLKSEEKEAARIAEEKFKQELVETDIELLYRRHKKYKNCSDYIASNPPSLKSTDFYPNRMSVDNEIFFYFMIGDEAKAVELIKIQFFKIYGYTPSGLALEYSLIDWKREIQRKQRISKLKRGGNKKKRAVGSISGLQLSTRENSAQEARARCTEYVLVDYENRLPLPSGGWGGRWLLGDSLVVVVIGIAVMALGNFRLRLRR